MSFGLKITNTDGQLILSESTTTFYFYGPAEPYNFASSDAYGGVTVVLFNCHTSKPIIPFVSPKSTAMHAITRVFKDTNGYWNVELAIGEVTSNLPDLMVFTAADAEEWADRYDRGDMTKGLKVKRSDGSIAFDSSVGQPMAIQGALTVIPPANPNPGGSDLTANQYNEYNLPAGISQPMFGYYSLAMSERQYQVNNTSDECTGVDAYGACFGFETVTVSTDLYWAFYRAGCAVSGTKLRCGWLTYSNGHLHNESSSTGIAVFIPIIDLGGGGYTSGSGPFVNQTINRTNATVLLTDRSFYESTSGISLVMSAKAATNFTTATTYEYNENDDIYFWQILMEWMPSSTPSCRGYNLYYRTTGTSTWHLLTYLHPRSVSSYVDVGNLIPDDGIVRYFDLKLVSVSFDGSEGGYVTASASNRPPAEAVTNLHGAIDWNGSQWVGSISWTPSTTTDSTGYRISWAPIGTSSWTVIGNVSSRSTSSFTYNSGQTDHSQSFSVSILVETINYDGSIGYGQTATIQTPPPLPGDFAMQPSVSFDWDNEYDWYIYVSWGNPAGYPNYVTNCSGFNVYMKTTADTTWAFWFSSSYTGPSWQDYMQYLGYYDPSISPSGVWQIKIVALDLRGQESTRVHIGTAYA